MKVVVDQPHQVAAWASKKLGLSFVQPFTCIGIEDDKGNPRNALIFNDYTGENVEISMVGFYKPKTTFRIMADYVFNQLGCQRATMRTKVTNTKIINLLIWSGFRVEGRARAYYPGGDDALLFGMLRSECNWINQPT